tara:strand:- start:28 stop:555 length:528 start_codon:yes stop_codon:yes gene_type:complete
MSELRTNRIVPRDGLPSGSSGGIIQVKSTTKTDTFTTNSTSFTDITGLSVSITPTRSDNKILVMMHVNLGHTNYVSGFVRLVRDSTAISVGDGAGSRIACTVAMSDDPTDDEINCYSATFLDSPSTTSATTYKVQLSTEASGNTGNVFVNRSGEDTDNNQHSRVTSSITVMEVSG